MRTENYTRKIRRALISVYSKDGIEEIARELVACGVELLSTGGTFTFLKELGLDVTAVEEITSYPSILGGRVKTLHPKVFGGILYRREHLQDIGEIEQYGIGPIDLVIVDLYPFEKYVQMGATPEEIIEKIDIGGIALIRAAAKNYRDVIIASCKESYGPLLHLLKSKQGESTIEERRSFARQAFHTSSYYDTQIFNWFNRDNAQSMPLRYGENPHQQAKFTGSSESLPKQLHGKEISYNNLLDIEAALELMYDFPEPTVAIIKHNNACGCASRDTILEAWKDALAGDPVSAFGGIIVANRIIDEESAQEINKLFFEVIIAPEYSHEALEILKSKKNRIILLDNGVTPSAKKFRSLLGGILVQDRDEKVESPEELKTVTTLAPTPGQVEDMLFANKLVKHSKSNAIVLAKDSMLLASGIGQTSRVDALRQAIAKAKSFGFDLNGAVMASDAFFPFPDCVEIAHEAGIVAVIQPGGSVRDQESIDWCNANGMAMVTTGFRHFKH
ncbi:MAG TPA: bifunctional phosphoribosylaminoimidazolecarboxamide formyltransferase/IMP cyclohydrolase [Bacteroidales bacterium]|nr:bifunctional phosphoribosylaminoimidazolecarboxamide formyltransferase/IMP cyclohydrolase [Bacteroidales bacterium]HPK30551.1 bifunctional phosphoribosylaminoimidazolecarboxamide formyltransferase/IMP cyclohydrolase [Bacteroidales bacterium]